MKIFSFLEVKFSIYLTRRVFVMYHFISCFENCCGTNVRQIPSIDHMNLNHKKKLWAVEHYKKCIKYIRKILPPKKENF